MRSRPLVGRWLFWRMMRLAPLAIDLVQRGAHGYCRKPPVVRELKAQILRAYELGAMKRKLENRGVEDDVEPDTCDDLIGNSSP